MPHHCNVLRLEVGQRLSLIMSLCALALFLSIMPCTLGYCETINMPVSALSFNASFSPAGPSLGQVLGFYNGDPLVNKYSVTLQDGIEVYASASTPTSLGGRPNVNSSGSFMATVVGTSPFSYLEWSLIGQSQSIISATSRRVTREHSARVHGVRQAGVRWFILLISWSKRLGLR